MHYTHIENPQILTLYFSVRVTQLKFLSEFVPLTPMTMTVDVSRVCQ